MVKADPSKSILERSMPKVGQTGIRYATKRLNVFWKKDLTVLILRESCPIAVEGWKLSSLDQLPYLLDQLDRHLPKVYKTLLGVSLTLE